MRPTSIVCSHASQLADERKERLPGQVSLGEKHNGYVIPMNSAVWLTDVGNCDAGMAGVRGLAEGCIPAGKARVPRPSGHLVGATRVT